MKTKDPKAQIEVWEWKEKVSQELNSLPPGERIAYINRKNEALIALLGIKKASLKPRGK
jgi:hypothetical protein